MPVWRTAACRREHRASHPWIRQRVRATAGSVQTQRGTQTQGSTAPGDKVDPVYMPTTHTHTHCTSLLCVDKGLQCWACGRSRDQVSVSLGSLSSLLVTREGFTKELELQPLSGGKPQPVWTVSRQVQIFKFTFVRGFEVIYSPVKTPDAAVSKHCQASETGHRTTWNTHAAGF